MDRILSQTKLLPYLKIAKDAAKTSPCMRRQYGAVVVTEGPVIQHYIGVNSRESKCCGGGVCSRTALGLHNGERVEVGGEVHAETAAIINAGISPYIRHIIIAGFMNNEELYGKGCYPCHTCALNLKYAGFKRVYVQEWSNNIISVPLNQIIEERELEWRP